MQPRPQTTDDANGPSAPEAAFDIFPDAPAHAASGLLATAALLALLALAPRLDPGARFRFQGPPPGAPRLTRR